MEIRRFLAFTLTIFYILSIVKAQKQDSRQFSPQAKETTSADFVRLLIMRLIFGIASMMGYGESLSNFLGGAFVPPGSDYEDDYDFVPDLF